jgi:starch synthase
VRLVVLGAGEERYEQFFFRLQERFPEKVFFYRGFHGALAHEIEAASDMFLMPSFYEPCGLNQMYSLMYGTIPIVHATGGLADTVEHFDPETGAGDGVVFDHPTPEGVQWALGTALDLYRRPSAWKRMQRNGMEKDFSWEAPGRRYVELYERIITGANAGLSGLPPYGV